MSTVGDVILSNLETLYSHLPAVRDGDSEAIHDARVATRRLRAALPLQGSGRTTTLTKEAGPTVKALGRALGKARESDEALRLLEDIERRSPGTAAATGVLRARLLPEQLRNRRRLIKTLEKLDLEGLHRLRQAAHLDHASAWRRWRPAERPARLAAAISQGAERVDEKMRHASGVYFPNRAHNVRIAIKKLRYAAEMLAEAEPVRKPAVRALRRAQEALGSVHDREVLLGRLCALAEEEDVPAARDLARVLEAECRSIFDTYRQMRPAVAAACGELAAWSHRRSGVVSRPRLLVVGAVGVVSAAGAMAVPSAMILLANRARRAG